MNQKRVVAWLAAVLVIGGALLLVWVREHRQSVNNERGLYYVMTGHQSEIADIFAAADADRAVQAPQAIGYVLLLAGAGAAITAVALRREP